MEITEYDRKPFSVKAVEVTFENYNEVAEWCKGAIELETTKMMGTETKLPVIKLKGQGDNRGKEFTASLGCFVVELKGSFRVYKQAQFFSTFEERPKDLPDDVAPETKAQWEEDEPFVAESFIPVSPGQI